MEPRFLDDETLTDNLNDEQASRIISWLITVFEKKPEELDRSLIIARGINSLKIIVPEFFDELMSQLEAGYEKQSQ